MVPISATLECQVTTFRVEEEEGQLQEEEEDPAALPHQQAMAGPCRQVEEDPRLVHPGEDHPRQVRRGATAQPLQRNSPCPATSLARERAAAAALTSSTCRRRVSCTSFRLSGPIGAPTPSCRAPFHPSLHGTNLSRRPRNI